MQGSILCCKISISKALLITASAAWHPHLKSDTNGMLGGGLGKNHINFF
jgi:hypothetical protein